MSHEKQNSAERAAEEILEGEYAKARAEECPQGDQCAVHFRVNEVYFDQDQQYARLITYVGEHVVVTEDNHEMESPSFLIKIVLGLVKKGDLPPRWETSVIYVGDGALADLTGKSLEERRKAFRYLSKHDDWDLISEAHHTVVSALEAGLIDVSKPLEF